MDDIEVFQKDLHPDANAVEDADIYDENLPSAKDDASGDEPEEEMAETDLERTPTFSDVYILEFCCS